ncbi:MAG: glucoamylase family protein [Pseudobdellovibrionaceae bacterium]
MQEINNHTLESISNPQGTDFEMYRDLQCDTFDYFIHKMNRHTGLIADKTDPNSPASIGVVGLALSAYIVGIERHWMSREEAIRRTLLVLRFLAQSHQGSEPNASGFKGFYYHFMDMETGRRVWDCELSTIDTALLLAGAISSAIYFDGDNENEIEIRQLVKGLYERVDWRWAQNGGATICHGWKPETGFLPYRWNLYYSEALILYILALASPTSGISPEGYREWSSTFEWKKFYEWEYIYAGPLFIHQMSHIWLDFRGIQDDINRKYGIDYFENSRRATYIHQRYAIENPRGFSHYGRYAWGFTASDGPGPVTMELQGQKKVFYGYRARGAPEGPDDGTISPWAAVASLPFAPEIVNPTVRHAIERFDLKRRALFGLEASFNPTFPEKCRNKLGWVSPWKFGLNQGPIILMIENAHNEMLWKIMKRSPLIIQGLLNAGFRGGWLDMDKGG